jgi:hypothetical protein
MRINAALDAGNRVTERRGRVSRANRADRVERKARAERAVYAAGVPCIAA